MTSPSKSLFVWFELVSNDTKSARDFYGNLFGWEFKDQDMGHYTYTTLHAGEAYAGGMMRLEDAGGTCSYWQGYISVPEVEGAIKKAQELGGKALTEPMDIPETGRFAVLQDPKGGSFAAFTPAMEGEPPAPVVGTFCWSEVLTQEPEATRKFYTELLGWETSLVDMGEAGTYTLFKDGEKDAAGMMTAPPESKQSWIHYILVDDVDAIAAKADELGGKIWAEAQDVPGIGRFSVLSDPTGAFFAVFKPESQA